MTQIAKPSLSIEFFPPKTDENQKKLDSEIENILNVISPEFLSVTFGAGGSVQSKTLETVKHIKSTFNVPTAAHLTCIGTSRKDIDQILNYYQLNNINHLVVLRGDLPSGSGVYHLGDFRYASDLVRYIREQHGNQFDISVAAYPEIHPESSSYQECITHFSDKVNSGANRAITQYFFNIEAFEHFQEQCDRANINTLIIPGIMPITNYKGLIQFSERCGTEIPKWIKLKLEQYQDDATSLRQFGLEVVSSLCQKLLKLNVEGLHFYSLNKSDSTIQILNNLELSQPITLKRSA